MWFKISQFRTPLEVPESDLGLKLAGWLQLPIAQLLQFEILRKSLDARHKELRFVYTLVFEIDSRVEVNTLLQRQPELAVYQPEIVSQIPGLKSKANQLKRPVIIGAGPAGLFAGLRLALAGLNPLILERGDGLTERLGKINLFWQKGILDLESNIQYGVGGAGTFSDGKLTTRIKDPHVSDILKIMVELGAPPEIRYWQSPHIGTDLLRGVIEKLQTLIIDRGGEIRFRSCLTDITLHSAQIAVLSVNGTELLETDHLILATGNSARDVYGLLEQRGLKIGTKPLAIGLRIEHPQDLIDRAQYGKWAGHPRLGAADYKLTYNDPQSGRGVYTFCMCPGGSVIGASSEANGVVTNGMSYHARASGIANSAVVVTVGERDFGSDMPLAGIDFQRRLEQAAFQMGGGLYRAPAQRVGDFLRNQASREFKVFSPSYLPGVKPANLGELFPTDIAEALRGGIRQFGKVLKGFDWPDAVLTGIETRTSAPVRIFRNEQREAEGIAGIYPVGEGSGYAGGIISSAVDGWKTAETIAGEIGER